MKKYALIADLMRFTLAAGLVMAAACKNSEPPIAARTPQAPASLPMPADPPSDKDAAMVRELDARLSAEDKLAEINQRTMVAPAPADFRPEPVERKIRLKLVLEKSKIRIGEAPRFRLELTNVGQSPIVYREHQSSIFKGGSILHSMRTISFYLTDRSGKRQDLLPALGTGRAEPIRYHDATPTSEKEMRETAAMSQASTTFRVKLLPGETLRSLGDGDSAQEAFRTLRVEEGFDKPGKYKLQVVLDDRPKPMNDIYIKYALRRKTRAEIQNDFDLKMKEALGPVSTDAVPLEIGR